MEQTKKALSTILIMLVLLVASVSAVSAARTDKSGTLLAQTGRQSEIEARGRAAEGETEIRGQEPELRGRIAEGEIRNRVQQLRQQLLQLMILLVTRLQVQLTQVQQGQPITGAVLDDEAEVKIFSSGFSPASVKVRRGGTVIWVNEDSVNHVVASDPHPTHTNVPGLESPVLAKDGRYQFTFRNAGTYTYHDHLNPALKGTVIVE